MGPLLLSSIFFIIALIALLRYTYVLLLGKNSLNWLDQPAEITSSQIIIQKIGSYTVAHVPSIDYSYTVKDHQYLGNRISIGLCPWLSASRKKSSFFKATGFINKYQVGQPATIYYNPDQPDSAVLQPGVDSDNTFFLIVSIVFILIGISLIILA